MHACVRACVRVCVLVSALDAWESKVACASFVTSKNVKPFLRRGRVMMRLYISTLHPSLGDFNLGHSLYSWREIRLIE